VEAGLHAHAATANPREMNEARCCWGISNRPVVLPMALAAVQATRIIPATQTHEERTSMTTPATTFPLGATPTWAIVVLSW
jgi:hypothetical protein